jgi:hypothetical protein
VSNNIYVTVEDGPLKGNTYIVAARHIVKKVGAVPSPVKVAKTVRVAKPPAKPQTVRVPAVPVAKTKKITHQTKMGDETLLKNLAVGSRVIINPKLSGKDRRSIYLVKIIDIDRRKKTKQLKVIILEGSHKGRVIEINPSVIVSDPKNPLLPASPDTGRKQSFIYPTFNSLPLTRKPRNFKVSLERREAAYGCFS